VQMFFVNKTDTCGTTFVSLSRRYIKHSLQRIISLKSSFSAYAPHFYIKVSGMVHGRRNGYYLCYVVCTWWFGMQFFVIQYIVNKCIGLLASLSLVSSCLFYGRKSKLCDVVSWISHHSKKIQKWNHELVTLMNGELPWELLPRSGKRR
jgi:hypothetical protein